MNDFFSDRKMDNVKILKLYDDNNNVIQQTVIRNGRIEKRIFNTNDGEVVCDAQGQRKGTNGFKEKNRRQSKLT